MRTEAALEAVRTRILACVVGHPIRVGIDGITAAGKTTFADGLAAVLRARHQTVIRVSMDGFHNRRAVRYRQGRHSADGYYEDAYDFDALRIVLLEPLGPAGDRRYRPAVIDLGTDEPVGGPARLAGQGDVLVVDGSFLQKPVLRGDWDVMIFLRTSFEAAEERGAMRDAEALGGLAAARSMFRNRYHAAQHRYLSECDPEARADIVIDVDDPSEPVMVR